MRLGATTTAISGLALMVLAGCAQDQSALDAQGPAQVSVAGAGSGSVTMIASQPSSRGEEADANLPATTAGDGTLHVQSASGTASIEQKDGTITIDASSDAGVANLRVDGQSVSISAGSPGLSVELRVDGGTGSGFIRSTISGQTTSITLPLRATP